MWILLASLAWPCQPPQVYATIGGLDGHVLPEDGGFPVYGAIFGAEVEVFGPDGAPVPGTVEEVSPGQLGRWIADAPMSPDSHHVVFTDHNLLRVTEVDFEVAGTSAPPPDLGFEVTAGDWTRLSGGPCGGDTLERPVTLTFDAPEGIAVAIEDAWLGHGIDAAWTEDGVLEVVQRSWKDIPVPACFRVRAVGWDRDIVEELVCDEPAPATTGCRQAPGPAAWWLLLLVTASARRVRPRARPASSSALHPEPG